MNFFGQKSAAERYAQSRPYFHPLAIQRILERTGRVRSALDVACGTGMSTRALLEMTQAVTGCDLSDEMLECARHEVPQVKFVRSSAEALPFPDSSFELLTSFLAFHWFDQPSFLREARRVLEPEGWLVICNHYFAATLRGHPEFQRFCADFYAQFPSPSRQRSGPEPTQAHLYGFDFVAHEGFTHTIAMNAAEVTLYISSQSNVIARVEHGDTALEVVLAEIERAVKPMLGAAQGAFEFRGALWFLKAKNQKETLAGSF